MGAQWLADRPCHCAPIQYRDICRYIEWEHSGWQTAHAEYLTNELTIDGSGFHGTWFESTSYSWEFNYIASSWNEWSKYANME